MSSREEIVDMAIQDIKRAEEYATEANDQRLDIWERQVFATLSVANATMAQARLAVISVIEKTG